MRIFRHYDDVPPAFQGAVVAVGNFDGVHRGHAALIGEAGRMAKERGAGFGVLAFEPHPQEFFRPSPESIRLTPFRAKARLLEGLGVDVMYALAFDAAMAAKPASHFVNDVLVKGLGVGAIVVGDDFRFGRDRTGNIATLAYMGEMEGFGVTVFDTVVTHGDEKISSTRIRDLLKAGKPDEAASLLGHYWAVESRVEHGDARGRGIGFPTANMHLTDCLKPAFGVYAVRATIIADGQPGMRHDGVANFGIRPMFETKVPILETYLFDFDGDLYGRDLSVEFVAWLRPEANFADLAALKAQIARDSEDARLALAKAPLIPVLDA